MSAELVWAPTGKHSWFGHAGSIIIGMVTQRDDGIIVWKLEGIHAADADAKQSGQAVSIEEAKLAANRSWRKWVTAAGLEPQRAI